MLVWYVSAHTHSSSYYPQYAITLLVFKQSIFHLLVALLTLRQCFHKIVQGLKIEAVFLGRTARWDLQGDREVFAEQSANDILTAVICFAL